MFALAIYDTRTHTLILARDRFGIKPLFYALRIETGSPLRVRSARFKELPGIDLRPDRQAIYDFAALFTFQRSRHFTLEFGLCSQAKY